MKGKDATEKGDKKMKKQLTIKQVLQQVKKVFRVDLTELSPEEILNYFDGHGRFFFNESGSYHKSEEAFDIGDPRLVDVVFDPIVKEALADRINECYGGERMRREHSGFDDDPIEEEDGRLIAFLNLTNHELDLAEFAAICADLTKTSGTRIDVKMDWAFNASTVTMTIDEKGEVRFDGAMTLPLDNRENFAFGLARGLELFGDSTLDHMEQSGFVYEYDEDALTAFMIDENECCYRYAILKQNEPSRLRDKVLVLEQIPGRVIVAVRGKPILNDVTRQEAVESGLGNYQLVDTGCAAPGVVLSEMPPDLQQAMTSSDLIISKGQGNYESLEGNFTSRPIYYLLRVKCPVISRQLNAPLGSIQVIGGNLD